MPTITVTFVKFYRNLSPHKVHDLLESIKGNKTTVTWSRNNLPCDADKVILISCANITFFPTLRRHNEIQPTGGNLVNREKKHA